MASSLKIKLLGGVLALLASQAAMAVGLGNIKLNSALNEPLDAEIELLNTGDLSDLEMLVGLASRKAFERAGTSREFFLTSLKFTIDLSGPKPKVLVKTQKPVREPYLDFLVELQWPTGRLLKEYTLLVDLPVYAEEKPQAKAVDIVSTSADGAPQATAPRPARSDQLAATREAGGEYRVRRGDTLWGIARDSRPHWASIQQVMVAIHELNPDAFVKGDINMLMRGEVLRLPADHRITSSHSQAVNAIAALQQSAGALLDAADTREPAGQQQDSEPRGQLKLSASGEQQASDSDSYSAIESEEGLQQSGDGTQRNVLDELIIAREDLIIAREELARRDRELDEYKERLAMLEEQLETARLINLQSEEAAAVQAAVSQPEADPSQQQQSEPAESGAEDLAETVAGEVDFTEPAATAAADEWSRQGFVEQYKYYLISGVGVLVLLLIMRAMRRRKPDIDTGDDFVFEEKTESVFSKPETVATKTVAAKTKAVEPEPDPVVEPEEEVDLSEDDQLFAAEVDDLDIDGDEIATKLNLAKAYSDVGDKDGAREMLEEVVEEGNEEQQREAKKLLEKLGA